MTQEELNADAKEEDAMRDIDYAISRLRIDDLIFELERKVQTLNRFGHDLTVKEVLEHVL